MVVSKLEWEEKSIALNVHASHVRLNDVAKSEL